MNDLFEDQVPELPEREVIGPQSVLLRHRLHAQAAQLMNDIRILTTDHPFQHMVTRSGHAMSVATVSCGQYGWVSDTVHGYRYATHDPLTHPPWPAMPAQWQALATQLAEEAGFAGFMPDSALVNRYAAGTRMGLHQDRDEASFGWPIVSLSLGLPARFMFGGLTRQAPVTDVTLLHGDVVAWGGVDRLRFHGIRPLKDGHHSVTGCYRYNVTFRRVAP